MVPLRVLRRVSESRCGLLLLGLFVITAQLMGQSLVGTGSQPFAVAVNPATNTIYVVNNGPNTVTVIDGATNATRTVIVGTSPVAISVNPVTNEAYVANSGDGTVTVINEAQGSVRRISVGDNPQAIVVNPLTNKIYVAIAIGKISDLAPDGNVKVIDGRTDTVSTAIPGGKNPFAIALNPVTNHIYVANEANGSNATVDVIDGSNDTLVGSPIILGNTPSALAVNPVTNKIYVANGNVLSIIDGASNTSTTTALPNSNPTAIVVNPVTNFIYVTTTEGTGTVVAINGATNSVSGTVAIGNAPSALAVNSLTNRIYVTDHAVSGHVFVIDGSTNTGVDSIATGNSPAAVAVNPVTNRVYVANFGGRNVAVVDGTTRTTNTISAGSNPNALAVNHLTHKAYVANIGDNTVTVIDSANGGTTSIVNTGTGPTAVAVNPATNKIYVPNSGSADVTVIDGLNGNATTQVSAGQGPVAVAVSTVNNKTFVTNSADNSVTVIDGVTNATSNVSVGIAPKGLAINEATSTIVVANQGSDDVTFLNGITNKSEGTVAVGNSPVAVGVNPAENNYYVVNQASSNVTVIDGDTQLRIDVLPFKGPAMSLALYNDAALRSSNDLDLLVRDEDFPRAEAFLLGEGFFALGLRGEKDRRFCRRDLIVELHFELTSERFSTVDVRRIWSRSRLGDFRGKPVSMMSKEDLVLYLCYHGLWHGFSRLIWIMDVARALRGWPDRDYESLLLHARRQGLQPWMFIGCEVVRAMFPKQLPEAMDAVIASCPKGAQRARRAVARLFSEDLELCVNDCRQLYLRVETSARQRWLYRQKYFVPTVVDYQWAHLHRIKPELMVILRPFRLFEEYGFRKSWHALFPSRT